MSPDTFKRIITAAVAVPVLILFFVLGGIPFFVLILFVSLAGILEMSQLMKTKGAELNLAVFLPLMFVLHLSAYINSKYFEKDAGLIIYIATLSFTSMTIPVYILLKGKISDSIKRAGLLLFSYLYINFPLSLAILLRNFEINNLKAGLDLTSGDNVGGLFLFFVIAVTFLSDTGAYFVGRRFGKRKLAPLISPKKSIEGAVGGIALGTFTAVLVKSIDRLFFNIAPDFTYLHALVLGFILCIAGITGDLFESMMKRDADIKDTGGLLPGHGGILDRLDSLNFTIPITYFYVKIFYTFL